MKILIADDHKIVREGLRQILLHEYPDSLIDYAENGTVLLTKVAGADWDIVITDISMPLMNGLDALREIRKKFPLLPVLVLSMHTDDYYFINALKAGASGYLTKSMAHQELTVAIKKILSGKRYIPELLLFKHKDLADKYASI